MKKNTIQAKNCKQGFLYRFDEKDVIGVYTPITPCQVVVNGIATDTPSKSRFVHFVTFHSSPLRDGTLVQGTMVDPKQKMIQCGELPKI